jgi:mRNA-degrading endonuclease HigB of HigAB toxin-antitoxin module
MRVVTNRRLLEFSVIHRDASGSLQAWRKTIENTDSSSFAELRLYFARLDIAFFTLIV